MDDVYKNIEGYNPNKERKILMTRFLIMLNNKKRSPTVAELFIRGRTISISLAFIKPLYFAVPKKLKNGHENKKRSY